MVSSRCSFKGIYKGILKGLLEGIYRVLGFRVDDINPALP